MSGVSVGGDDGEASCGLIVLDLMSQVVQGSNQWEPPGKTSQ